MISFDIFNVTLDIGEIWTAYSITNDFFIHPILFFSEVKDFQFLSWRQLGLTDPRLSSADYYVLYQRDSQADGVCFDPLFLLFL